ncbi:hypothetical protein F5H01DRAFT_418108, partial [Linnemannia elongata]
LPLTFTLIAFSATSLIQHRLFLYLHRLLFIASLHSASAHPCRQTARKDPSHCSHTRKIRGTTTNISPTTLSSSSTLIYSQQQSAHPSSSRTPFFTHLDLWRKSYISGNQNQQTPSPCFIFNYVLVQ